MTEGFPDLANLDEEAEAYVAHPDFDKAMLAWCRGLAEFHSVQRSRRAGVVDTVTWAATLLVVYLDATEPQGANTRRLIKICAEGPLAGAKAVRNAIALLRQGGMVIDEEAPAAGRARRLRPTVALIETMRNNLAIRFSAMEPVVVWPKPAMEWARTEGVLARFVRGNVEAYRRERHILFEPFPEVRTFMDRHCGYHILMDSLSCLEISTHGASGAISVSRVAEKFAVSRAHVRKLFAAAAVRGWLDFETGGRLTIRPETLARYRLWFGNEFAWVRRVAGAL